jgi:XTP/dITP diphosphohydrolase
MALRFVTTNPGKVREAREYLTEPVEQLDVDTTEIQHEEVGAVAAHKAREAHRYAGEPVIVDDSGLFVEAFGGFPGPYSSYVHDRLGIERVWRLAEAEDDRTAAFRGVVAYCDGEGFAATTDEQVRAGGETGEGGAGDDALPVKLFEGVVPGEVVAPRGEGGFGYDPVFEYDGRTFAEMDRDEKNAVSHRGRALAKFAEWYETSDRR